MNRVLGVATIGVGKFTSRIPNTRIQTKEYKVWYDMIFRCYSGKFPNYIDCSVSDDWLNFQNFAKWYTEHKNYGKSGYHLDKDLTVIGNKIYSKDYCDLIPATLNNYVIRLHDAKGYYWSKKDKKFIAKIRCIDHRKVLGYFVDEIGAKTAYEQAKKHQLSILADKYEHEIREEIFMNLKQWSGQLPTTVLGDAVPMVQIGNNK